MLIESEDSKPVTDVNTLKSIQFALETHRPIHSFTSPIHKLVSQFLLKQQKLSLSQYGDNDRE